eukprot:TRINITY_DN13936_c0_g1_i1.p1 TRINITY_DN13936_c0_g1~~TRINITY_DN13936_c0_g1_i1.p1  ORF type:complete len:190 (-),score=11.54 TRINITY_DN13936_c0_g1_i1:9-578(-)
MEFAPIQVTTVDYIITAATGNIINRKSKLFDIDNISVGGQCIIEEGAILHGDYAEIELGLNCYVGKGVQLAPTAKQIRGSTVHLPMRVGDHVIFEEGAVVRALSIGSNTYIGKNAVIGPQCIISENCFIEENATLPLGTVLPPFSLVRGSPAQIESQLYESFTELHQDLSFRYYRRYQTPLSRGSISLK